MLIMPGCNPATCDKVCEALVGGDAPGCWVYGQCQPPTVEGLQVYLMLACRCSGPAARTPSYMYPAGLSWT